MNITANFPQKQGELMFIQRIEWRLFDKIWVRSFFPLDASLEVCALPHFEDIWSEGWCRLACYTALAVVHWKAHTCRWTAYTIIVSDKKSNLRWTTHDISAIGALQPASKYYFLLRNLRSHSSCSVFFFLDDTEGGKKIKSFPVELQLLRLVEFWPVNASLDSTSYF